MGDMQFNGTQKEWDALVEKNKRTQVFPKQKEISDEEIEKAFIFYFGKNTVVKYRIWTLAINWYKEKLKQKQ